ncbi:MAG: hypothetical protein OEX97_03400 [Acidimicrobiia bacterium]|nr:hypothetical protein [Acidimicrobiia bacterium]
MQREVFHFKTVAIPYDVARRFMRDDPGGLFSPAVDGSTTEKDTVVGLLEVDLDGIIMGADVTLEIGAFEEIVEPLPLSKRTLGWHASEHAGIFPILTGELEAFPAGDHSTQITFTCHYRPPLKAVGAVVDTVYLHRIADDCLERFFDRVIDTLEHAAERLSD